MPTATTQPELDRLARCRIRVTGQVQGVGFRPAVYRWAVTRGVTGRVFNDARGVVIEAESSPERLAAFEAGLTAQLPRLAEVESLDREAQAPRGDAAFVITPSLSSLRADAAVTVDTAVCAPCLAEMRDPRDRRFGHPLINCTDCGPRFSIIEAVPYDRPNTTMKVFEMCERCRQEYDDPADRRFHAQPVCCPGCGPRVVLHDGPACASGAAVSGVMPAAARRLMTGEIVAIKGVGGFHLAVRAEDEAAVRRLRERKHRDAKPLAVMVRDVAAAKALVDLSASGEEALRSAAAPIVLAPRRPDANVASGVAPGTHRLGVMLPYTPMHHQIFDAAPDLGPLVMTSGNLSDEPLVTDNDEAIRRLNGIADRFVMHDRRIARGVDDSVVLDMAAGGAVTLRRSRGMVPGTITLTPPGDQPADVPPGLCVGGELKTTVAVVRRGQAILGQHLGDLKHPRAYEHFRRSIDDMLGLFDVEPAWVACDRHPGYLSHAFAARWAERGGVPLVEVQHHHAHAASLMAEHGLTDPILALVADGVGYGDRGEVWGGELLLADRRSYRRLGRLRPLRLPGGDASSRDTRRCALALLRQAYGDAGLEHPIVRQLGFESAELDVLSAMLRRNVRCIESSALGRVFDGVAALLGLCFTNRFEAEAPMAVEAAAYSCDETPPQGVEVASMIADDGWMLDVSPLVQRLVEGRMCGEPAAALAKVFQDGLADVLSAWTERVGDATGIHHVGLTGGVFANEALTLGLTNRLGGVGRTVWRHAQVPPNDGGLSLGQAVVAVALEGKEG